MGITVISLLLSIIALFIGSLALVGLLSFIKIILKHSKDDLLRTQGDKRGDREEDSEV